MDSLGVKWKKSETVAPCGDLGLEMLSEGPDSPGGPAAKVSAVTTGPATPSLTRHQSSTVHKMVQEELLKATHFLEEHHVKPKTQCHHLTLSIKRSGMILS